LHLDLASWCIAHMRPVPASRRAFVAVLQSEGFQVTSDGLVYGLILKADLETHERFDAAPDSVETAAPARCKRTTESYGFRAVGPHRRP
jgi:hypothetical protein